MRLIFRIVLVTVVVFSFVHSFSPNSNAFELDWSGQFRADANWVKSYDLNAGSQTVDQGKLDAGGYTIAPSGGKGSDDAFFQTLFFRLRPKVIVNDNIYIHSEWWVGDPIYGMFGSGAPYTVDQSRFYSSQSRGALLSAQRLYADIITDIGTFKVGRAPLNWGLGLVWNDGEKSSSRYPSTGDVVSFYAKFGAVSVEPAFIKYSNGNAVGGQCYFLTQTDGSLACEPQPGFGGMTDASFRFSYQNLDDDLVAGLNFIRRFISRYQDPVNGVSGIFGPSQGVFNTWSLYFQSHLGPLTFRTEIPIIYGELSGVGYETWAAAGELEYKIDESWSAILKAGRAPGQVNKNTGENPSNVTAFYFHPDYNLALIMFNYQLANFAGPNTQNSQNAGASSLVSPFDHSISNATYANLAGHFKLDKWTFKTVWTAALANTTAKTGKQFYNYWAHEYPDTTAVSDQKAFMGFEGDLGVRFDWDDSIDLHADGGMFFPGAFYKFSNTGSDNKTDPVISVVGGLSIKF